MSYSSSDLHALLDEKLTEVGYEIVDGDLAKAPGVVPPGTAAWLFTASGDGEQRDSMAEASGGALCHLVMNYQRLLLAAARSVVDNLDEDPGAALEELQALVEELVPGSIDEYIDERCA